MGAELFNDLVPPHAREVIKIVEQHYPKLPVLGEEAFHMSPEELALCSARHLNMYEPMAASILADMPACTVICGGMYSGKSTLTALLINGLSARGERVRAFAADVIGKECFEARALSGGSNIFPAKLFGDSTGLNVLNGVMEPVVVLEEFSFLDPRLVQAFVDQCLGRGQRVILTGCDTTYLGIPLPLFRDDSFLQALALNHRAKFCACKSFIKRHGLAEAVGTHTIRYFYDAESEVWRYDAGIFPAVVPAELDRIVKYVPAIEAETPIGILTMAGRPDLVDRVLNPCPETTARQQQLLQSLRRDY